jgi:uncharacterized protein
MVNKIFINLPVKDLQRSSDFFTQLGFSFNPQFTDEKAACMIISDEKIFAMLIREDYFSTFTKKQIADAGRTTEVLLALDVESRERVDELIEKAIKAGGSDYMEPQDHGWMYYRTFADPDGHLWEVMYGDESQIPKE